MKALRALALVVAVIAVLVLALPVHADQANPDETPTIKEFNIYRHVLETNDYLLLIYENTVYTTTPNATATDAFLWRLYSTDNVTELAQTSCFSFDTKGYGYNLISMYFDNTTILTWGTTYYVKLAGNPSIFTSPPLYTYQLNAIDYSTANTTADAQDEITDRVLEIARDLYSQWGLNASTTLTSEFETQTYLSANGQAFFRGAIPSIQTMAPDLFPYAIGDITIEDRDWETTYSASLATQWAGTWVEDAQNAGEEFFELDYDLLSILLVAILGVLVLVANIMLSSDTWGGLMDVGIVLIATARLGLYPLAFLALLAALAVVYIALKIWGLGR